MRCWKCIESKREDWFTVDKIYKSEDGKIKDNDGDLRDADVILNCDLYKFTEVKEQDYVKQEKGENKMEDLGSLIVVGRVVKFDDGKISRVEINNWEENTKGLIDHYITNDSTLEELEIKVKDLVDKLI